MHVTPLFGGNAATVCAARQTVCAWHMTKYISNAFLTSEVLLVAAVLSPEERQPNLACGFTSPSRLRLDEDVSSDSDEDHFLSMIL